MQTLMYLICILSGVIVGIIFGYSIAFRRVAELVVDVSNDFIETLNEVGKIEERKRAEKSRKAD